jgi:hypothetical protein
MNLNVLLLFFLNLTIVTISNAMEENPSEKEYHFVPFQELPNVLQPTCTEKYSSLIINGIMLSVKNEEVLTITRQFASLNQNIPLSELKDDLHPSDLKVNQQLLTSYEANFKKIHTHIEEHNTLLLTCDEDEYEKNIKESIKVISKNSAFIMIVPIFSNYLKSYEKKRTKTAEENVNNFITILKKVYNRIPEFKTIIFTYDRNSFDKINKNLKIDFIDKEYHFFFEEITKIKNSSPNIKKIYLIDSYPHEEEIKKYPNLPLEEVQIGTEKLSPLLNSDIAKIMKSNYVRDQLKIANKNEISGDNHFSKLIKPLNKGIKNKPMKEINHLFIKFYLKNPNIKKYLLEKSINNPLLNNENLSL